MIPSSTGGGLQAPVGAGVLVTQPPQPSSSLQPSSLPAVPNEVRASSTLVWRNNNRDWLMGTSHQLTVPPQEDISITQRHVYREEDEEVRGERREEFGTADTTVIVVGDA